MEVLFYVLLGIVFYTYLGYGVLLVFLVKIKRLFNRNTTQFDPVFLPTVSFIIPCYNERDVVEDKIKNCLALDYPKDKLEIIFITDGSTDGTNMLVAQHEGVKLLHDGIRGGKSAAENRSLKHAIGEIIVFSDANTELPIDALKNIVRHYINPKIGAVSGEKRIAKKELDNASGAGEGIYWKYESFLKRMDVELYSLVGAAGELFSFRKSLFVALETDTVLDDFMLSMRIAGAGHIVTYDPEAYAIETASASVKEELKRKVRICAGGWQAMVRLAYLLNPFKNFVLWFQYVSHRVLRWSVTPVSLALLIPVNILLVVQSEGLTFFHLALVGQVIFYSSAIVGWVLANKEIKVKVLYVPYYFLIMNYAVIAGFFRYINKSQAAAWERSARAKK